MNTEPGDRNNDIDDEVAEIVDEPEVDEDAVVDEDDGAAEMTAEVNVEELVAKLDAAPKDDVERRKRIRKRLEEHNESKDLDSTYNFNLDEDL
ncbi:MAG: hypothetical protein AAFX56_02715 [Pseudomonadota bacterium]